MSSCGFKGCYVTDYFLARCTNLQESRITYHPQEPRLVFFNTFLCIVYIYVCQIASSSTCTKHCFLLMLLLRRVPWNYSAVLWTHARVQRRGQWKLFFFFVSPVQMTEQRKQKQRIGLLGHPPHMNINPQQPAWGPLGASFTSAWALLTVYHMLDRRMPKKRVRLQYVCAVGRCLTVYFTRCSYNKCFYDMCASECLFEVEVIWVCYSQSVVWMCLCWVEREHQVPRDLRSQSCRFRRWKNTLQPWMPSALYHTNSMPKFSHCSWGSIPLKWPCIEGCPRCCTSKLRSHVDLKVCLNSTTHYLIFFFAFCQQ